VWPVVHQQLGVAPDLGRGRLAVVPQVPPGQPLVAGRSIRLGAGAVDVAALTSTGRFTVVVSRDRVPAALTLG
ncbi:MAG TPA: hypothetical protein VKP11_09215, partial [Frankiaceae bacterium]|nr:hypothetical protein [Frankiaceae bacterium]